MFAASAPPSSSSPLAHSVRARLWLAPAELGLSDPEARLWLHLHDGRVLAFRLPSTHFGNDSVIAPLAAAVADDARGTLLEIPDPAFGYAIPLYAAAPAPMPNLPWGHPGHEAARSFAQGLDQQVLRLLANLERWRAFSSARNYNRLATLKTELRERRMQAIGRFPPLVAPTLLTAHHSLEYFGGKRHAWRNPDSMVIAAIDQGLDLSGALAIRYGISRALVRSPLCGAMWGSTSIPLPRLLHLIDGIPAHRRPRHPREIERFAPYLVWLNHELDERMDLFRIGQTTFKAGWSEVWEACEERYSPLRHALADTRDFLRAALACAARTGGAQRPRRESTLTFAWLEARGLPSLLKASARWHAFALRQRHMSAGDEERPRAILGDWHRDPLGTAREITHFGALAREGAEMHHCVAQYWADCVEDGARIFSLHHANGERATAEYRCYAIHGDLEFRLEQLRGPCNAETNAPMRAFAKVVETMLNAPERKSARAQLMASLAGRQCGVRTHRHPPAALDPASEKELAAVLAHRGALPEFRPLPGERMRAFVAGYEYHRGAMVEEHLAAGEPLSLVREADNPHDGLAVRIDWRGEKLGYVPRADNAEIARRIDAGEQLCCRINCLNPDAAPWRRLEFVILDLPLPGGN